MSIVTPQPGTGIAGTRTTDVAGSASPKRAAMWKHGFESWWGHQPKYQLFTDELVLAWIIHER